MGIYYITFLCTGTFTNSKDVTINNKTIIASCNIVENHEWMRGYVDKNELQQYVNNHSCELIGENYKHIENNINITECDNCDVFIEEEMYTTYDGEFTSSTDKKYILVK